MPALESASSWVHFLLAVGHQDAQTIDQRYLPASRDSTPPRYQGFPASGAVERGKTPGLIRADSRALGIQLKAPGTKERPGPTNTKKEAAATVRAVSARTSRVGLIDFPISGDCNGDDGSGRSATASTPPEGHQSSATQPKPAYKWL